jgi:hypothetical protein
LLPSRLAKLRKGFSAFCLVASLAMVLESTLYLLQLLVFHFLLLFSAFCLVTPLAKVLESTLHLLKLLVFHFL